MSRERRLMPQEPPTGTLRERLFAGRGSRLSGRHPARAEPHSRADRGAAIETKAAVA